MRILIVLAVTAIAGPAVAEVTCIAQGANLVCYEAPAFPVQPIPAMMSTPDYSAAPAYAEEQVPVYTAPFTTDLSPALSTSENPYDTVDTVDSFGATGGGVCQVASLDPNAGC